MNATCPVCKKPCMAAEIHAYGKCEDCYSPAPDGIEAFGRPGNVARLRDTPADSRPLARACGGGHRVIRTPRGLS